MSLPAYQLLVRTLVTRGRVIGVLAAGALLVSVGIVAGLDGGSERVARTLVDQGGIALLVPLVAVVFATSTLGDHAEDGTLVYLWMRPVGRPRIATAALAAGWSAIVPLTVLPLVAVAITAGGGWRLVAAAGVAGVLAGAAYGALFTGLGLLLRRALLWGVLYAVIWEGVLAGVSARFARLSVRAHAASVLAGISESPPPDGGTSLPVAITVLLLVVVAGAVLSTWALQRTELRGS